MHNWKQLFKAASSLIKKSTKLKTKFSIYGSVKVIGLILLTLLTGLLLYVNIISQSDSLKTPVHGTTHSSWDKQSFWFPNWGESNVHKGIDIFAPHKTLISTPVSGFVLDAGYSENGGNYIYILGPKLRLYYFAHLNSITVKNFQTIKASAVIGTVGNTGNAALKPYHLHFSVSSLLPVFSRYNFRATQGWKQMFYFDPGQLIVD